MRAPIKHIFALCLFLLITCSNDQLTNIQPENEVAEEITSQSWDSLSSDDWTVIWEGHGEVTLSGEEIVLEPMSPTSIDETHAALVLHQPTLDEPISDFMITVSYTLDEQLRVGTPNSWETFWLFFNTTYDASENDVTTNYFILKPNGIELGIADTEDGQTFLYTDDEPTLDEGDSATISLTKLGQELSVSINGLETFTYDSVVEEEALLDVAGSFGLYTEDARITVRSVKIEPQL